MFDRTNPPSSTSAASTGSAPAERVMRIAPLDLRAAAFPHRASSGFDQTEVVAFLTEAADDYEHALREIDRLRQDSSGRTRCSSNIASAKATCGTRCSPRSGWPTRSRSRRRPKPKLIIREAQGRADLLLQKAQGRLEEVERDINELRLRRRDVEGSLEGSIQALYRALEFIREQDRSDDKVLLHRPRQTDTGASAPSAWASDTPRAADERG